MRVFVAGGSGAIGRALLPRLAAAGHQVTATTRRPERMAMLEALGARPVLMEALDQGQVAAVLREARPDVVMSQLTDLPQDFHPRRMRPYYEKTSPLRVDGTRHLLEAMPEAGARRFIYQSIAFMYQPRGPLVLAEDAPLALAAPEPFGAAVRGTAEGERLVLEAGGIEGVVLRYGQLYGPNTYYCADGYFGRMARRRRLPVIGAGQGVLSFLHVDDAATSAIRALEHGQGVYNVVDDEPAPMREWVPVFCRAVGAGPPFRLPVWVARLVAGPFLAEAATGSRGASNSRARAGLGWEPAWPSWREGFAHGLDRTLP